MKHKATNKATNKVKHKATNKASDAVFPVRIGDSEIHGQGVFATRAIKKGETVELCPYIVIDDDDVAETNRLQDYLFSSPSVKGDYLCVLGYGMIYNHSDRPNAEWEIYEKDNRFVRFLASETIGEGDEILQDYGKEYWASR